MCRHVFAAMVATTHVYGIYYIITTATTAIVHSTGEDDTIPVMQSWFFESTGGVWIWIFPINR